MGICMGTKRVGVYCIIGSSRLDDYLPADATYSVVVLFRFFSFSFFQLLCYRS